MRRSAGRPERRPAGPGSVLVPLAVTSPLRSPVPPDVPPVAEAGVKGVKVAKGAGIKP